MKKDRRSLSHRVHEAKLAIAVDGPAGAGKTTIGCRLARLLRIPLLDTGLMYRLVTRRVQEQRLDPTDAQVVERVANALDFHLEGRPENMRLLAGDRILVPGDLHQPKIDRDVSIVAAHPNVRRLLVETQRSLAGDTAIVMLGRDITTVVLPDAQVKLFVTADANVRAERRAAQREWKAGETRTRLIEEISLRDRRDIGRDVSPLRRASDAVIIDTSEASVEQSVGIALEAVVDALERSDGHKR